MMDNDSSLQSTENEAFDAEEKPFHQGVKTPSVVRSWNTNLFDDPNTGSELYDQMGDGWAVPWSDLMMVMFVVFAVLYMLELAQPELELKYQPQPVTEYLPVPEPIESPVQTPSSGDQSETLAADITDSLSINVFEESAEAVQRADLAEVKVALLSDQSVKVSVEGPLLFELGKAELRNEVQEFLDSLAFVIRKTPFRVRVIGHTDDQPINTLLFPSNWELSLVRASTVARYLIDAGQLDPTRFTVMGRGQYAPVAANDNDSKRALNRRVEIIITREKNENEPQNEIADSDSAVETIQLADSSNGELQ